MTNKLRKINVLTLAIFFGLLLIAASGAYSITRYTSGHHIADSRNPNATGTPVLMVNGVGAGVAFEVRDASTPVFQIPDGGGVVMASGFDLNGQALTWDADADTISVTSFDDTITTTLGAATGKFHILTGNLAVGNGTNDVTLDGEDTYLEGTLEVDGLATLDGGTDYNGASSVLDADADTILSIAVDDQALLTIGTAAGYFNVLTGNLNVGNGTPSITQDGEDVYIEGTLETDGLVSFAGVISQPIGIENFGTGKTILSQVITYTVAAGGSGTLATIADGEIWFVHSVFIRTTTNFDATGDDVTFIIGDGGDTDGFIAAADANLQATFTEATGYAAGWYGIENGSGGAYTLDDGGPFVYAPSGAPETIDWLIDESSGETISAGSLTAYLIYTRIQ